MLNPDVTQYIENIGLQWQAEICTQIRAIVHQAVPDAEEKLQYRKPHFLKGGKYLCVLGTAKGWVSWTIFNATTLMPPDGMFESSETGDRKTVKLLEGQTVDTALFSSLIAQAAKTLIA